MCTRCLLVLFQMVYKRCRIICLASTTTVDCTTRCTVTTRVLSLRRHRQRHRLLHEPSFHQTLPALIIIRAFHASTTPYSPTSMTRQPPLTTVSQPMSMSIIIFQRGWNSDGSRNGIPSCWRAVAKGAPTKISMAYMVVGVVAGLKNGELASS